ncbi:MAG: hypothetical protein HY748_12800 [Elusimicrobia bacterium]|nr:hypothetical protein [Elusimicrobiota bacterium]
MKTRGPEVDIGGGMILEYLSADSAPTADSTREPKSRVEASPPPVEHPPETSHSHEFKEGTVPQGGTPPLRVEPKQPTLPEWVTPVLIDPDEVAARSEGAPPTGARPKPSPPEPKPPPPKPPPEPRLPWEAPTVGSQEDVVARFERSRAAAEERRAFLPDLPPVPPPPARVPASPPPQAAPPPPASFPPQAASPPQPAPASPPPHSMVPGVEPPPEPRHMDLAEDASLRGDGFRLPVGIERTVIIGIGVVAVAALATPVAIYLALRGRAPRPEPPAAVAPVAQPSEARPAPAQAVRRPVSMLPVIKETPKRVEPQPAAPAKEPPKPQAPGPSAQAAPKPAAPGDPIRPSGVAPGTAGRGTLPADVEAPAVVAVTPLAKAQPPKPAGKKWVFRGRVYDLINLSPVYDAKLTFLDPSGKEAGSTVTKDEGRFEIALDALPKGGYRLSVQHFDYRAKYIDDINPPFDQVDDRVRRPLADAAPVNKPWIGSGDAATKRDFVMVPKLTAD